VKLRPNGSPSSFAAVVWRPARVDAVLRQSGRCLSAVTLDELLAQTDLRNSRAVIAMSGTETWCQMLTLPTAEAAELETMLELKLDTVSPLASEESACGFLPLEKSEGATRLLLVVASKALVNERVAALNAAGITAETVTVDVLALFHWLLRRQRLPSDDKVHALLHVTEGALNLVFHTSGQPVIVRSMACEGDAGRDAVLEELRRSWLAAELQSANTGRGRLVVVADTTALRPLAEQFRDAWGTEAECLVEEAEAPLSALAASAQADGALNLLPKEWKQRRRSARLRQRLIRASIALGLIYLAGVAVFGAVLAIERAEQHRLATESARLQPQFVAARKLRDTLSAMQVQLDVKFSSLEVLREISKLMPDSLKLTDFVFLKNQTVTLRGMTSAPEQATEFIGRMENSPMFSKVKTISMPTQGGLTRFDVICTLQSATTLPTAGGGR